MQFAVPEIEFLHCNAVPPQFLAHCLSGSAIPLDDSLHQVVSGNAFTYPMSVVGLQFHNTRYRITTNLCRRIPQPMKTAALVVILQHHDPRAGVPSDMRWQAFAVKLSAYQIPFFDGSFEADGILFLCRPLPGITMQDARTIKPYTQDGSRLIMSPYLGRPIGTVYSSELIIDLVVNYTGLRMAAYNSRAADPMGFTVVGVPFQQDRARPSVASNQRRPIEGDAMKPVFEKVSFFYDYAGV